METLNDLAGLRLDLRKIACSLLWEEVDCGISAKIFPEGTKSWTPNCTEGWMMGVQFAARGSLMQRSHSGTNCEKA
jgi:hypothetical protein